METLVVVAQQEQFHTRNRGRNHGSYNNFRDINCRTFQSRSGILPSPVTKHSLPNSPKTPCVTSSNVKKHVYSDQNPKHDKRIIKTKSVPIPLDININIKHVDCSRKDSSDCSRKDSSLRDSLNDDMFYSELWAGPAYSNSPPPSSLPIPKFSVKPKRTVSLELPSVVSVSEIDLFGHVAKSAPPSPTREHYKGFRREFGNEGDEFATKTLRRILNLDMADE